MPVFATSASAATIGAGAAKDTVTAGSSAFVAILTAILGPVIGLLGAYVGVRASLNATRTPRERAFVVRQTKRMIVGVLVFNVLIAGYIFVAVNLWKQYPVLLMALGTVYRGAGRV